MIIEGFKAFVGQHCETTVAGSLLNHIGLELSEPMLFGLGEGLGFIYWDMKSMDFPFVGGRIKQNLITNNLAKNLGLDLHRVETSSSKKAWETVKARVDSGQPVGLQLDCYYLDYFTTKVHFGGHFVAMYGYNESSAFLVDTSQQGTRTQTGLSNLSLARGARGPMTSRNMAYTITASKSRPALREAAIRAISANATDFLTPPIANLGYKGISKAAKEIKTWLSRTEQPEIDLALAATLMERGGTGGALFRNLYRDFLGECFELVQHAELKTAHRMYTEIAPKWTEVSCLINEAALTGAQHNLDEASKLLSDLANSETAAMQILRAIGS